MFLIFLFSASQQQVRSSRRRKTRRVRFMVEKGSDQQKQFEALLDQYRGTQGATIPVLQQAQEIFGYLPKDALLRISKELDVPISKVYGVVTFYSQFHLEPRGKTYHPLVSGDSMPRPRREAGASKHCTISWGLKKANVTTEDGMFTLETVACIGACALAPCLMVDDETHGRLTPEKAAEIIDQYKKA
jgi:NADH:ubiquinone oxidoreductase subunit E